MRRMLQRGWGWMLLMPMAVLACRYSVRDTGFVDLGAGAYRLEWVAPADLPEKGAREWAQAAAALLAGSNVQYSEARAGGSGMGELRLSDPAGRTLSVARVGTGGADAFRWMDSVVSSPARERLLRESLRSYAVVVVVEGTDSVGNARVGEAVRAAIGSVSRLIPSMPKPVSVPPQVLVVPVAQQAEERVLMWGLGLEPETGVEPRVALVYGRGRRLGGILEGPLITATALRERLVLVGQDCECDLDRAWLRGAMIPARWDAALQQAAAKTLGFDPENPMVRAEVGRIVDRGPVAGQKRRMTGTSQELGYSEDRVDAVPVAAEVDEDGEARHEAPVRTDDRVGAADPMVPPVSRVGWWVLSGVLATAVVVGVGILFRTGRG